jgi:tetratricopeptide (TPR) repeat protein
MAAYQEGVAERLRQAEQERLLATTRARQEAEARQLAEHATRQERKVRRLTGLLLVGLLVAGLATGIVTSRRLSEQSRRQFQLEQQVEALLSEARGHWRGARRGGPDASVRWARAEAAARQASDLLHPKDPAHLHRRVGEFRQELESEQRQAEQLLADRQADQRIVTALDRIRLERDRERLDGVKEDAAALARRYERAFFQYRLDVRNRSLEEAARQVRGRRIAVRLAVGLLEWALVVAEQPQPLDRRLIEHLVGVASACLRHQPQGERALALVHAVAAGDAASLGRLARPESVSGLPVSLIGLVSRVLIGQGRDGEAVTLLRQAVRDHPGDFWMHHDLSIALAAREDSWEEARAHAVAADALRPNEPQVTMTRGALHLVCGSPAEALACFRKVVALSPRSVEAHCNLGSAQFTAGQHQAALASFQEARRLNTEDPDVPFYLCQVLTALGRWQEGARMACEAIRLYRPEKSAGFLRVVSLERSDNAAGRWTTHSERRGEGGTAALRLPYRKLAICLLQVGDRTGAVTALREQLQQDPTDPLARGLLGGLLIVDKGPSAEALAHLELAVCLGNRAAETLSNLSNVLSERDQQERAVACARLAIAAQPDYATGHLNLGVALLRQGKVAEALPALKEARRLDPTSAKAVNALGEAYRSTGRFDEAWRLLRHAGDLDPKYDKPYWNLAMLHVARGQKGEALACLRRYRQLRPDDLEALYTEAALLRELDRPGDAVPLLRQVLARDPRHVRAWHNLGIALTAREDHRGAVEAYRRCLEIEPDRYGAHLGRAVSLEKLGRTAEALRHYHAAWLWMEAKDEGLRQELKDRIAEVKATLRGRRKR